MNVKNRSCIRKLSFRALWASRKRNIIAILAIVLMALLFTSIFTVTMSIVSSYETYTFRQLGAYNHGTFKDVTEEQAQAIAAHPKVKAAGGRMVIGFVYEGVFAKTPAEVSFMDENCTKWSYAQPTVGHMPQGGNEITMDTGALELLGVEPQLGAEIPLTFTVSNGEQMLFEKTDRFTLTGYWEMDDISPVHYLNVSRDYADTVEHEAMAAGAGPFRTDLNVMMASAMDIRGQMEQVDLDLGYDWETRDQENSVRIGVNWGYTSSQLREFMDAQTLAAILAFLALVIFTGYLIIYNIFQISVTGDIRFYGLLKTIGVTPRQLRRIIRQQALLLCVAGIPAGLLLGYGVGAVLTPVVMARSDFLASATTISTSPLIFLASALFALLTVLLSCSRPGRIAAKVSPVEATKYTEAVQVQKKRRATRGAKVHQMALANLGRSKSKTVLVVISLALSVVLLNALITFTGGFDMEKYLAKQSCADFLISSTDYFRYVRGAEEYIPESTIRDIQAHTVSTTAGCGYTLAGYLPNCLMTEEAWQAQATRFFSGRDLASHLAMRPRQGELVSEELLLEGLDTALFDKLTVVEGDLAPIHQGGAIALVLATDDYGAVSIPEHFPALGDTLTVRYVQKAWYIDSRTGEMSDENTPQEFFRYHIDDFREVSYRVCAYVTVPPAMGYRYGLLGAYEAVLPLSQMTNDSGQRAIPLFYLFDTPEEAGEREAERYLAGLTGGDHSTLMYESKASLRREFEGFQSMFLLLGGLLCAIIGLVGVLNFFNAVMTGILSRQREFAVLQAVGMTGRQLKAMLVYEGLFYALGASGLALILSLALNPLVGRLLETMFWFFSASFTVIPVLLAIPVFALLGFAIPSVIYGQTAKQSVVERLRET